MIEFSEKVNRISGASLSSNQIILPGGHYKIKGSGQGYACNSHRAVFYNISDNAIQVPGSSARAKASYYEMSPSFIDGEFLIGAEKIFELRHIAETANPGSGLGKATNLDSLSEIYASLEISKLDW
ncbi:MAG: hypothetical protein GY710_17245 [Desulfobacteraceae bacterium]|nr:hypothetical protein [Desulfobacteraceae bacterium]